MTKREERTCDELHYPAEYFINVKCLGVGDIQKRSYSFLKGHLEPDLNGSMGLKREYTNHERDGTSKSLSN